MPLTGSQSLKLSLPQTRPSIVVILAYTAKSRHESAKLMESCESLVRFRVVLRAPGLEENAALVQQAVILIGRDPAFSADQLAR